MKKYLSVILVPALFFILMPLIFSLINLFDIEIKKFFYLGSIILMTLVTSIILGLNTPNKAYLKGLILGSIMSAIMFLISLLLRSNISIYTIVYYLIIIVSTMMGSIIGITKKR